jgi:hypothetical protein
VARAIEGFVGGDVAEREALVRAQGREGDDVAIGTDAAFDLAAELDDDTGRVRIGIGDLYRIVDLEVFDVGEFGARVIDARERRGGLGAPGDGSRGDRGRRCRGPAAQELAASQLYQLIAGLHGFLPMTPSPGFQRRGVISMILGN